MYNSYWKSLYHCITILFFCILGLGQTQRTKNKNTTALSNIHIVCILQTTKQTSETSACNEQTKGGQGTQRQCSQPTFPPWYCLYKHTAYIYIYICTQNKSARVSLPQITRPWCPIQRWASVSWTSTTTPQSWPIHTRPPSVRTQSQGRQVNSSVPHGNVGRLALSHAMQGSMTKGKSLCRCCASNNVDTTQQYFIHHARWKFGFFLTWHFHKHTYIEAIWFRNGVHIFLLWVEEANFTWVEGLFLYF